MSPEETKKTVDELAASLLAPRFAPPVAGERPAPPRSAPDIPGQGLVHGVGYGIPPQGGKATRLIFASPAPQCVLDALAAKYAKRGKPVKIVASGPIVGLQSLAVSIGADAAPNYNAPPFYAGTLTGIVTANGTNWLLGCNHVVSFNGRVPTGSPVRNPGLARCRTRCYSRRNHRRTRWTAPWRKQPPPVRPPRLRCNHSPAILTARL